MELIVFSLKFLRYNMNTLKKNVKNFLLRSILIFEIY